MTQARRSFCKPPARLANPAADSIENASATEATTAFVRDQIRLHRGKLEIARALELLF